MKIILTGSLGNISKPLTIDLVQRGHSVTAISSKIERKREIEALGARAAIGSIRDLEFLTRTFTGADIVYLMEPSDQARLFDSTYDIYESISGLVTLYKKAVVGSGVKRIVHLSSIGAHTDQGVGLLKFHFLAESVLKSLPADVSIKFMRPVGFYGNLLQNIETIKSTSKGFIGAILALQYYGIAGLLSSKRGVILANYGGNVINLLVSPNDIASVIAEEMEMPFEGRTIRYIASEEPTCDEVAKLLGKSIGKDYLKWGRVSDKMIRNAMLKRGMNKMIVDGLVEMGAAAHRGELYEDYYKHRPLLGKTKLRTYAPVFAEAYQKNK